MSTVKTAISIEQTFLEQVDRLSHKLKMSRSQFFCLAARRLADQAETARLLQEINLANEDASLFKEDQKWLKRVNSYAKKRLKNEKW
jgi:hypothetical protein